MTDKRNIHSIDTLCAQALGRIDAETRALVPPVHVSTTFERDPDNSYPRGWSYIRDDNPGFDTVEALMTALEGGAASLLFSAGMAAATTVFLALNAGDHVLAPKTLYWGLRNWLLGPATDWGLKIEFVDVCKPEAVAAAIRPGTTKLIWSECPSNPLWEIVDLAALAGIARGAGAKLAVDSTAATPVLSRPIDHGADIVMHSATKYLNGHSDVLAGTLTTAADDDFWQRIRNLRGQHGVVLGSFECWLLLRGMRTLSLRVRHSSSSALQIAGALSRHPAVLEVLYPGLPQSPFNRLAQKQMSGGFGGMLSIRLKGGEQAAIRCASRVKIWKRATSLGGVESLIEHRASVEGVGTTVPSDLLRLSTGLEDASELEDDLLQALQD
jgi:cystathionine gamma-synthase